MSLSPFEWTMICAVAAAVVGTISYFLKRTMNTVDNHDAAINDIKQNYAPKATTDSHDKDINTIKQTYVTKDELKELKAELRSETGKLAADVADIKEHYIRRDDFYRSITEVRQDVDKVYAVLIKMNGGNSSGQE